LESFPGEAAAGEIVARLRAQLPAVRRESLRVLTSQPLFIAELLKAMEAKKIQRSDLDAEAVRLLKASTDAALKDRIALLLKDTGGADRVAMMQRYRAVLATQADAKRGRGFFEQNCATCHRIGTLGSSVGPDISDTLSRESEALLNDILDPNAAIDTNFTAYTVKTKQGVVLNGIIAARDGSSLTLRNAGGKEDVLLMQDVADVRSSGLSLMPEGLEQVLPPEALRDLIAYIRNWRDVEGK
jgi:putative heme-binding domain-containing protein